LKKTETPYVIKKLASDNLNEDEELYRETRSILNKLTPENLQKLTVSLINLPITNEVRLRNCIDIIFEKAIDEQVFSQTYGQLSKVLAQVCYRCLDLSCCFLNCFFCDVDLNCSRSKCPPQVILLRTSTLGQCC